MASSGPNEIERKFLIRHIPDNLEAYPVHELEQGYLSVNPVVRVRRWDSDYILTYKSGGMMVRKEVELPLSKESFEHLIKKADGTIISKKRYIIPDPSGLTIELDMFTGHLKGFIMAEVEFPSEDKAASYTAPDWFGKEVTYDPLFHNSKMSLMSDDERADFLARFSYDA